MIRRTASKGFTTLEIILVLVIIGVLSALVFTTRSGVEQNQRNSERQRDIKELRDGMEGYFAANNHYPTLQEVNDPAWRNTHLKALESDAFRDPSGNNDKLLAKAQAHSYAYSVTSAGGTICGSAEAPCTLYTLTATLEGGGSFTKNNLN